MFDWRTSFLEDNDGAVTVDWVVITAAIAGIGVAVVLNIQVGVTDTASGIGAYVSDQTTLLE